MREQWPGHGKCKTRRNQGQQNKKFPPSLRKLRGKLTGNGLESDLALISI